MKNGFSLIELAMVIAIIAILASISITQYQTYLLRTYVATESTSAKAPIEKAIAEHMANLGTLPGAGFTELATTGFVQNNGAAHSATSLATKNIQSVAWDGQYLTLKFINNHKQNALSGETIQFSIDSSSTSIQFVSSGGTLASHLWP